MNRVLEFNIINHADYSAGLLHSESDVKIELDWSDDDSWSEVVSSFREAVKELYDTTDVATIEERAEQYRCEDEPDDSDNGVVLSPNNGQVHSPSSSGLWHSHVQRESPQSSQSPSQHCGLTKGPDAA